MHTAQSQEVLCVRSMEQRGSDELLLVLPRLLGSVPGHQTAGNTPTGIVICQSVPPEQHDQEAVDCHSCHCAVHQHGAWYVRFHKAHIISPRYHDSIPTAAAKARLHEDTHHTISHAEHLLHITAVS